MRAQKHLSQPGQIRGSACFFHTLCAIRTEDRPGLGACDMVAQNGRKPLQSGTHVEGASELLFPAPSLHDGMEGPICVWSSTELMRRRPRQPGRVVHASQSQGDSVQGGICVGSYFENYLQRLLCYVKYVWA